MKLPSKEASRARFWELKKAVDKAKADLVPLQAKRDAFVNKAREDELKLMAPIKKIKANVLGMSLFDAEQEMAAHARLLGGTVGEPV